MALVATAYPQTRPSWVDDEAIIKRQEENQELINVFLRMWDGKNLCCTINPKMAAITSVSVMEQRVLQCYPDDAKNFYFVLQGKPLNRENCNSVMFSNGSTVFVQYRNRGGCFMVSFTILTVIMAAIIGSTCTCGLSLLIVPVLLPLLFVLPLFCL